MMERTILKAEDLFVGYGRRAVVRSLSFEVQAGEILCLIGPNGAGKSTILKTLLRQLKPLGGRVLLDGVPLEALKEREFARRCAAVLTGRIDPELMRCEDVVAMGRYPYTGRLGLLREEDREKTDEAIRLVGLEDIRRAEFDRISDGQRQRVMLARALCQAPQLLLLDEPTSYLDLRCRLEFLELLRGLVDTKGLTVVMSMHELELVQQFADRVLCIRDGECAMLGTPEEVFADGQIDRLFCLPSGSFRRLYGSS